MNNWKMTNEAAACSSGTPSFFRQKEHPEHLPDLAGDIPPEIGEVEDLVAHRRGDVMPEAADNPRPTESEQKQRQMCAQKRRDQIPEIDLPVKRLNRFPMLPDLSPPRKRGSRP